MQTLLLLDSEIYSSDRFTFLTRSTRSQFSLSIAFKLKSRRHFPFMCAGYKNFHLFHIAFRTFIFVSTAAAGLGFPCGRFRVDNSDSFLISHPDSPCGQNCCASLCFALLPLFIFFFGLFISARLECVGVAADDVGRIGFGFVLCAN